MPSSEPARPAAPDARRGPAHRHGPLRRRGRLGVVGVVAGTAMALSALPASAGPPDGAAPAGSGPERAVPVGSGATPDVLDPTRQELAWDLCLPELADADPDDLPEGLPPGIDRLECADYVVPRDWDAPDDGLYLSVAVSRLPATDEADGVVLTNPGGPGGPGLTLPLVYSDAGRDRLTDSRDVVGIDVRGTGASTNVTCSNAALALSGFDPRNRSEAAVDLTLDVSDAVARACQNDPQGLSPVISTEQTVKDLDLLRDLLDRDTVDWIGYSGGTWLGAAYGQHFPDRVGRFVLDANTEFTSPWQETFELQPLGFQRRYESDFLPWAAKYDERFGLGASPEEVDATYERVRAVLGEGGSGAGVLVDNAVASSMYSKDAFSGLADFLAELDELADLLEQDPAGAGGDARVAADRLLAERTRADDAQRRSMDPRDLAAADAVDSTFLSITCNDTDWRGDRDHLVDLSAEQGEQYPLVGWSTLAQPCVFWDRPQAATLDPRTGEGVPPVLMVQNENDPATPIEGARVAREQFEGARLLEVENEGDHTVYPGNPCVDDTVEDFLLGVTEAADSTCQGVGLPEPDPVVEDDDAAEASPSPSSTGRPAPGASAAAGPASPGTPLERAQRWTEMTGMDVPAQP